MLRNRSECSSSWPNIKVSELRKWDKFGYKGNERVGVNLFLASPHTRNILALSSKGGARWVCQ